MVPGVFFCRGIIQGRVDLAEILYSGVISFVNGLADLAWQTDKGIILASALLQSFRGQRILLPTINVIERIPQGTFDFLGFTFYLDKSKKGKIIPKVKTSGNEVVSVDWTEFGDFVVTKSAQFICCCPKKQTVNSFV
jgi:hypothetical protein